MYDFNYNYKGQSKTQKVGYNIEMYTDVANYPNGIQDKKYYSEIWIPVKKK